MKNIWYFGLEPLKERYTYQLSNMWMPNTFKDYDVNFIPIEGTLNTGKEIRVGAVLDAVGRGQYALSQCANFLDKIRTNKVKEGDVIFLQDFWTSGIDSIFYALDLYRYNNMSREGCQAQKATFLIKFLYQEYPSNVFYLYLMGAPFGQFLVLCD